MIQTLEVEMPILPQTEIEPVTNRHMPPVIFRVPVSRLATQKTLTLLKVSQKDFVPTCNRPSPQARMHSFISPTVRCTRHKWQALLQILTLSRCGAGNAPD